MTPADPRRKYSRNWKNVNNYAIQQGREPGFATAYAEGYAVGFAEVSRKVAQNMKASIEPIEKINQSTGLSPEAIGRL